MPKSTKEIHFFDQEKNLSRPLSYQKYRVEISATTRARCDRGSHADLHVLGIRALSITWSYNPEMKWLLVLRNPVERAFSAWNMEKERGEEPLSFAEAIAKEAVRCRKALPLQHRIFSYIDRGFYAHQVRRLFNIFGHAQCLILLNEDLKTNHSQTMNKVFEFLGLDTSFVPRRRKFSSELQAAQAGAFREAHGDLLLRY